MQGSHKIVRPLLSAVVVAVGNGDLQHAVDIHADGIAVGGGEYRTTGDAGEFHSAGRLRYTLQLSCHPGLVRTKGVAARCATTRVGLRPSWGHAGVGTQLTGGRPRCLGAPVIGCGDCCRTPLTWRSCLIINGIRKPRKVIVPTGKRE